jgi:hypothetical protein
LPVLTAKSLTVIVRNLKRAIFNKERITILTDILSCLTPPHETEDLYKQQRRCVICGYCKTYCYDDNGYYCEEHKDAKKDFSHETECETEIIKCTDCGKTITEEDFVFCLTCTADIKKKAESSTPTKTECEHEWVEGSFNCLRCGKTRTTLTIAHHSSCKSLNGGNCTCSKPTPPDKDLVTIEKIAGRKVTEYAISVEGVEMFSFNKEELLSLQSKLNDLFPAKH